MINCKPWLLFNRVPHEVNARRGSAAVIVGVVSVTASNLQQALSAGANA